MATSERIKQNTTEHKIVKKIFNELEHCAKIDDQETKEKILEQFNSKYANETKFTSSNERKYFLNILRFLIKKSLLNSSKKLATLNEFYCLRILLRDSEFLIVFLQENGLVGLKNQMDLYTYYLSSNFNDNNNKLSSMASKALGDILRILQKLLMNTPNHAEREFFISSHIIQSITNLLNHRTSPLLQETLTLLLYMTDKLEFYIEEFFKSETIEYLFHLLEYKDLETIQLSLHLMATFLSYSEIRQYIPYIPIDFLYTFTSYLSHNNVKVLEHAIWCLTNCADNEDDRRKIRVTGAIPLLLSLLENGNRFDFSSPSTKTNRIQSGSNSHRHIEVNNNSSHYDQLFDMQSACCNCLAELSYNFTNSQTIIERNGIYILAMLLFPDNDDVQRLETFNHLQRTVFKILRFLFPSNERNDQYQYKRLFPASIFELFVGIGNFQRDPNLYKEITHAWNLINMDELTKIKLERLQSFNPKQDPTRFIRDYGVYECLGSGAFGSVYRVAQRGSTTMYALKEINKRSLGNDTDRSLGKMINEVNIIREELRHPNIVNYYQIFIENDNIYIKMELIVGYSLQNFLSIIKHTNQKMSEDNIWKVFIQLILALRYIHKQKGIVHRDLTANNIMLDDEYRVKITDFGLAKLHNDDCSKMTSVVGTMYYACPEIIQHLSYNEKADIWSLGCVLYHMAVLVPPFYTSNLLLLATKICTSEYDKVPLKSYSDCIQKIIHECLIVDPLYRRDICGIAQLCTEQLMSYTDRSCTTIKSLEKRLRERESKHERYILKQQLNHQSTRLSCSSVKESSISSNSGIPDVIFEGIDGQNDISKQESITIASDCETIDNVSNNIRRRGSSAGQTRSLESSNISCESGYDSNNIAQGLYHSSNSLNTERKSSATYSRSRPVSGNGSISISNSRLRATDPVTQLLEIVHKLVYISYIPPNTINAKYRHLIDRYKSYLFLKTSSHNLKSELLKLSNHSNDCIEFDTETGRRMIAFQSLTNSSSSNYLTNFKSIDLTIPESDGSVTYEQMMFYIDQILLETDYYKDSIVPTTSNDSLPPIAQKTSRPSSRRQ
ncbi:unnamed protein product [Adineta steineri]|uniref:Protein kinase domain-containing protein n=1 Tax=Adineta steineri TaxID=433720 RepID=A0A814BXV5_9BILA|nr:unnamed protein product [Adineta steineri]CAF3539147.1 unnamed protein product [Adineta steineri]